MSIARAPKPTHPTMAEMVRTMAEAGAFVALTHRALSDLMDELGGPETTGAWLIGVATKYQKPIALNFPNPLPGDSDATTTTFIPPLGWSSERLAGWIGGRIGELSEAFGEPFGGLRRMSVKELGFEVQS